MAGEQRRHFVPRAAFASACAVFMGLPGCGATAVSADPDAGREARVDAPAELAPSLLLEARPGSTACPSAEVAAQAARATPVEESAAEPAAQTLEVENALPAESPAPKKAGRKVYDSVELGLQWLAAHPSPDGRWEGASFANWCD